MMWIPTIVCAGTATLGCLLGWQAAFDPPVRIRELVGWACVGVILLALGIVVAEAVHQTRAWLS